MKTLYYHCERCKIDWLHIPNTAKIQNVGDELDGVYFNCHCKTTTFLPLLKATQLAGYYEDQDLLDRIKESFLCEKQLF